MKKIFLFSNFILLSLLVLAQPPSFKWATSAESSGFNAGHLIAVDISGNVYSTGTFSGTTDFDYGIGETLMTSLTKERDVYISKFDPNGKLLWAKQVGSINKHDISYGIALDASNNVYVTGTFYGTADFDPGSGVFNLKAAGSNTRDIFLLKLTTNGIFVWAKKIGGIYTDVATSITVDVANNVYLTGYFNDSVDFDPGVGTYKLIPLMQFGQAYSDGFILKLNSSGNFVWVKRVGGTHIDECNSITTDKFGSTYTTGSFINQVDFDPGSGIFELSSPLGGTEAIFILKLDSSGAFVWAKMMGGTSGAIGYSIAVDPWGNVYSTGMFQSTCDFDPGTGTNNLISTVSRSIYISKLNASGNFVWAKNLGLLDFYLITDNIADPAHKWGFTVDKTGNIYRTGAFQSTLDFDPGSSIFNLSSSGGDDIFISKLDSAGKFKWAHKIGGKFNDVANAIVLDNKGSIFTTGWYQDTVDFDLGTGKFNLSSYGDHSIFINKMSEGTGSTEKFVLKNNIKIYPNPSSEILNIDIESLSMSNVKIQVTNSVGQIVLNQNIISQVSSFDIQYFPSGIFLVKVMNGNNILAVKKIIKI